MGNLKCNIDDFSYFHVPCGKSEAEELLKEAHGLLQGQSVMLLRFSDTEPGMLKVSFWICSEMYGHWLVSKEDMIKQKQAGLVAKVFNNPKLKEIGCVLTAIPSDNSPTEGQFKTINKRQLLNCVYPNLYAQGQRHKVGYQRKQYSEDVWSLVQAFFRKK